MLELSHFHDRVNLILIFIISSVSSVILSIIHNRLIFLTLIDNHFLERVWIFIPSLFLLIIAVFSLSNLYIMDDLVNCSLRIKVYAHQWYRTYEDYLFYDSDSGFERGEASSIDRDSDSRDSDSDGDTSESSGYGSDTNTD